MRKLLNIFCLFAAAYIVVTVITSCARMRQPDGGWYDEVPPRVVASTPMERATNVSEKKIEIRFNEFVQLDNATENVVICPPQLEQPEITTKGKSVIVQLVDSLKENTTYTVDFSDAIKDYNEGNPLGNFTFTFSTGDVIDTLEVSGYVVDAETLEPVAGTLVGLYSNLADSAFTTLPMERIGRTDASGHFVIRGIAPGKYRVYSLQDSDNDYKLSQRSEMLAFSHNVIEPTSVPDTRQDTTWVDSLHIGGITRVPYTRFLPDDLCLRAFTQEITDRYLVKTERPEPDRFSVYFNRGSENMPVVKGLNFNDSAAFVIEPTLKRDSITYWLRDTMLINQDTLLVEMTYEITDSAGVLVNQTDTIEMLAKVPYEKRLKKRFEEIAKWEKKAEKDRKKGKEPQPMPNDSILEVTLNVPSEITPVQNLHVSFPYPLEKFDTAAIHLYSKIDSLWYNSPIQITDEGQPPRTYEIRGEWRPGIEYSLEIDSAAFVDIYGHVSGAAKKGLKVAKEEKFSSLFVNMIGVEMSDSAQIIVQMIEEGGKLVAMAVAVDGTAEFYYVKPGKYYLSAIIDANRNGKWDTGDYALNREAEYVYFKPELIECKEKWDLTTEFRVNSLPLYRQKPAKLVKTKAQKKTQRQQRNLKRAKDLNVPYDKEKVDSKF